MLLFVLFSEGQKLTAVEFTVLTSLWRPIAALWSIFAGVLKDYLRELPSPLITKQLYEAVLDAMGKSPLKMSSNGCENELGDSKFTVGLLNCLPDVEKVGVLDRPFLKAGPRAHCLKSITTHNLSGHQHLWHLGLGSALTTS